MPIICGTQGIRTHATRAAVWSLGGQLVTNVAKKVVRCRNFLSLQYSYPSEDTSTSTEVEPVRLSRRPPG